MFDAENTRRQQQASIEDDKPPLRALLVEDHPSLAVVTAAFLSGEGLDVRTALSGRDALDIARTFAPQLVLCDLSLPDMSGLEVVRELRSRPSTARSGIVILTAMDVQGLNSFATNVRGVDAFVSKPSRPRRSGR